MSDHSRRDFLKGSIALGAATLGGAWSEKLFAAETAPPASIRFGMVTYQWGKDWDLPTLLRNCEATNVLGVELRTTHAHGVEPSLSDAQRREVKKRFADSPVKLVSLGTTEEFHSPDPEKLKQAIEATKAFVKLGQDVGSTGVKVRPNALPKEVPQEKTIEQIGKSLNIVGAFAADYGQQIRLEIHGGCNQIPIIKQIIDIATHPNVGLCWNSNSKPDLEAPGLEAHFNMVKNRLGATTHVRQLDSTDYPFQELLKLFVKAKYRGWWLLEAGGKFPDDRVKALGEQKAMFDQMLAKAMA
jgi:hypothetical protein